MRYSPQHKDETRRKVVQAAAAQVRAKGPDALAVAEVMAEAGLTHGGFYAHFPSKAALVAAAVEEAFEQGRRRYGRMTEGMAGGQALGAFVDGYVSMEHRAGLHRGCPLTSLASDLPRQGPEVREVFEAGLQRLIVRIAGWLPDAVEPEALATSLVAEMAGAVTLSRSLPDDAAARLLARSRQDIKARTGLSETEQ